MSSKQTRGLIQIPDKEWLKRKRAKYLKEMKK